MDTLQEIYGAIMRNKMRTIATGFAVMSGLFLIIVLQGAGNGIIHTFESSMGQFAFNAVRVFGGMTTKPFEGMKEGRFIQLDNRDVEMTERSFRHEVNDVLPSVSRSLLSVSRGEKNVQGVTIKGVQPAFAVSQAVKVLHGRFINAIDIAEKRKSMVISSHNAEDLFGRAANAVGQYVNADGVAYRVVGVYKSNDMWRDNECYGPFSTVATIYNRGRFLNEITMNLKHIDDKESMETFMDNYRRASSFIHSYAPDDKRALWIWNQAEDSIQMNRAKYILHTAFWILGLLTLISGVVGVSNIMLISVKERTREFGIRRAIGARPWSIIRMVMLESVVITAIFGYLGMLLGIFFCEWMDTTVGNQTMDVGIFQTKYFIDPTVDLSVCVMATVIIIIAGALAGFFPARRAIKVKPIDALRG